MKIYLFGASGKMGHCVRELTSLAKTVEEADALLDFSVADALKKNLNVARASGKPIVIGTTGHKSGFEEELKETARLVPVFFAANFSLGITLSIEMLKDLQKKLPQGHDRKMVETHHKSKKDAPSGTALVLAKSLGIDQIDSKRIEETTFAHEVRFTFGDETITVKHEAFSRRVFAQGALLAVDFVCKKEPGLYGMEDLIRERS